MTAILLTLTATLVVFGLGLRQLWLSARERERRERAVLPPEERPDGWRWADASRLLERVRPGRRWAETLRSAGIGTDPAKFLTIAAVASLATGVLLGRLLSVLLFPAGVVVGVLATRFVVRRAATRRREALIAQMPELARALSNATSAGLSVRTAVALAAGDLSEPARSEIRRVSEQLEVGTPLEEALGQLEERVPSRAVGVLVSTLVVAARSGGGLVTALRDIADTLETQKETRREVRTTYAQAVSTAYAVLGLSVGVLFLLDAVNPGTVDTMLREPLGQITLVVAGAVYAVGLLLVRRMTRVDV